MAVDIKKAQERLNALYQDYDYDSKSNNDKALLRNETIAYHVKERWKDESYAEKVSNKISKAYDSDEMRKIQASKSKSHTEETKEKIASAFKGKKRPDEVVEKIKEKRKGQAVYHKCFVTPSGAFSSKKAGIEWALEKGVRNPSGKFDKWLKERPDEFYYITQDEYEKIKDNPKVEGLPWMENSKRLKRYRDE